MIYYWKIFFDCTIFLIPLNKWKDYSYVTSVRCCIDRCRMVWLLLMAAGVHIHINGEIWHSNASRIWISKPQISSLNTFHTRSINLDQENLNHKGSMRNGNISSPTTQYHNLSGWWGENGVSLLSEVVTTVIGSVANRVKINLRKRY